MADESHELSAPVTIHACASSNRNEPPWSAEALVVLRTFWTRWTLPPLCELVRVTRGRAGHFEVIDFVLVLLSYAISRAKTLKAFYAEAEPVQSALGAVWLRGLAPSRSALSRFLGDVTVSAVDEMRTLF